VIGETRGVWKTKEPIPFLASAVLESGAFLYSKANDAMQAHHAPGVAKMHITARKPVDSQKQFEWMWLKLIGACIAAAVVMGIGAPAGWSQQPEGKPHDLELSRGVRPWEFLPVTGMRAGLLGNESGRMEAWVYPLKIFRDFHLKFHTEGRVLAAEALGRTVTVRPESAAILYAGDTFTVRETFFVPVREQGGVILLDVETEQPLEIEAAFHRDFQLEWPAALGATYLDWAAAQHAFYFGEEQRKFSALVGSPTATEPRAEFQTNYSESQESSFRLGLTAKGKERKLIVIAGSVEGRAGAEKTYQHLTTSYADLLRESAEYYRDYLGKTVSVDLPDAQIQQAYDWSRVSVLQGLVTNPYLGTGLVAGYRTSGESQRPGFAWFFGRDSFWTSFALNAAGDFSNARAALEFISKYQREDGKIPHEISQGANFVQWFKDYPYPYASADATPLYIIAVNDYVVESGDTAFAKEKWKSLWKAHEFLRSTHDEQGFPQNAGVGHGWVEGGPLLPIKTELYQTGLGIEALRALSNLAHLTGQEDASKELSRSFDKQKPLMNGAFWIAEKKRFAFALDKDNHAVDEPSVLATVPMWFGLLDEAKADAMITQIADLDQQTDWGMRIVSEHSPKFSGGGYHYGSVWPLFTGWATVGEYRYHRAFPAYANLRANALLALDGSLGHVTEVLSGSYYQSLSTSSPHQIWSAAMVVSPLLRGMFGLRADATMGTLTFAPHVPADWTSFGIGNVQVGSAKLDLHYSKDPAGITLELKAAGNASCSINFQPAVSLRAKILGVEFNGRPVPFRVDANSTDQHLIVSITVAGGSHSLRIRTRDDFGLSYTSTLPAIGASSQGLRIVSETWSPARDRLMLNASGLAGSQYVLSVWNGGQIASVEGARLSKAGDGRIELILDLPKKSGETTSSATVSIQFATPDKKRERAKR
jgi:glycogen debranching enzyme